MGACLFTLGQELVVRYVAGDKLLLASGSQDRSIRLWAIQPPASAPAAGTANGGSSSSGAASGLVHMIARCAPGWPANLPMPDIIYEIFCVSGYLPVRLWQTSGGGARSPHAASDLACMARCVPLTALHALLS